MDDRANSASLDMRFPEPTVDLAAIERPCHAIVQREARTAEKRSGGKS